MKPYFEIEDFNPIENKIEELTNYISTLTYIPTFTKKVWTTSDYPHIQQIYRIEEGIKNLVTYYALIPSFSYKKWLETATSVDYKNFAWIDYLRWQMNLSNIDFYKDKIQTRFCGEGYSGNSIWL